MTRLQRVVRPLVPKALRTRLRSAHRDMVFRRGMNRLMENPEGCARPGSGVLADLIYGWGNEGWSALDEYLVGCMEHALVAYGPILECGSGLSTVVLGCIARRRNLPYWALEHYPDWAARVRTYLGRFGIDGVNVDARPLRDYGTFAWYAPPLDRMPEAFRLVICDGPPGDTKDGRYGLVPVMGQRLGPGCVILLDDAGREHERSVGERWRTELAASLELQGHAKPYLRLVIGAARA